MARLLVSIFLLCALLSLCAASASVPMVQDEPQPVEGGLRSLRVFIFNKVAYTEYEGFANEYAGTHRPLPDSCMKEAFQSHFLDRFNKFVVGTFTLQFLKDKYTYLNNLLLLVTIFVDELISECDNGKLITDLATIFSKGVFYGITTIFTNFVLNFPVILIRGLFGIVLSLVGQFQYGGLNFGKAAARLFKVT